MGFEEGELLFVLSERPEGGRRGFVRKGLSLSPTLVLLQTVEEVAIKSRAGGGKGLLHTGSKGLHLLLPRLASSKKNRNHGVVGARDVWWPRKEREITDASQTNTFFPLASNELPF